MPRTYDLQVHTDASPCSATSPEGVVAAATSAELDGIAVTDHDTLANVERARDLAPPDLDVIGATEVTTTQGHLLALGVDDTPPQTDPFTVVNDIHSQGGVAVLSHPFDRLRQYYTDKLSALAEAVDAVETTNSRCVFERYNERARTFAATHNLPRTGGSDAHFPMELGRAVTVVPDGQPVLDAIAAGETHVRGRGRYLSGHVATKLNEYTPWPRGES